MDQDYEVFISYRHKDCNELAKQLHNILMEKYTINSFRDDEGLHFGDFRKQLVLNNLQSRWLVLLLTPGMLDRCHEKGDWITREISLFLRLGKPIIPVKMNGFTYPENLPKEIAGLLRHDHRAIECSFIDPVQTAEHIAAEVQRRVRKKWSVVAILEAENRKTYLSRDNDTRGSYFYESAILLRRFAVMLAVQLAMLLPFVSALAGVNPAALEQARTSVFVLGFICSYLLVFEFMKVEDPTDRVERALVDMLLDRPLLPTLFAALKQLLLWFIPVAIMVFGGGFLLKLGVNMVSQMVLSSKGMPSDNLPDPYTITIFYGFVMAPICRNAAKLLFSCTHFLNARWGRYPEKYKHWVRTQKLEKVFDALVRVFVVPAIVVATMYCMGVFGG